VNEVGAVRRKSMMRKVEWREEEQNTVRGRGLA